MRAARDDELDAAGRVVAAAYRAAGGTPEHYLAVVADARSRAGDGEVLVAVDPGGSVLGSVTLALPGSRLAELSAPGESELRMLGVDPSAQGRGIGRALLHACLARARARGAFRMVLSTEPHMDAAHRMYEREGFARAPELDWEPEPGVALIAYALPLARSEPVTPPDPADAARR